MAWQCDGEAASGKPALASTPGWCCPAPLALLPPQSTSACLPAARTPPTPGGEPVATRHRFATRRGRDPLSRTTRAVSSLATRAVGEALLAVPPLGQSRSGCSASQQPLPPRSGWRRPDSVLTAEGALLLGQAGFSEGSLMPSLLAWFSLLPLCCLVRSPSRRFDRIFRTPRPLLQNCHLSLND